MFALLGDGEQALIRGKITVGSEINGEFVCDFECGYSSNDFNTVASHEVYCLKNVNRRFKPIEVQLGDLVCYGDLAIEFSKVKGANKKKIIIAWGFCNTDEYEDN